MSWRRARLSYELVDFRPGCLTVPTAEDVSFRHDDQRGGDLLLVAQRQQFVQSQPGKLSGMEIA